MIVSNINIDNTKNNTNIKDIIKKYYQNNTNKIIINNNQEIILIGDKNIKYKYNDSKVFNTIYIPELISFYLNNNIITKEELNDNEYIINDTLYIINFNKEIISNIKEYINIINKRNNFKLELNNNCTIEDDITPTNNRKKIYSYGYINILLISFIIAVITIITCIIKLS